MKRDEMIGGTILMLVGVLFLANNVGWIDVDIWGLVWPLILIGIGGSIVWGYLRGSDAIETRQLDIPVGAAQAAQVRLEFGAGVLAVQAADTSEFLLSGRFEGGVTSSQSTEGDQTRIQLRRPVTLLMPWQWGGLGRRWEVTLHPGLPLDIQVQAGASQNDLDLSRLQVTRLRLASGASQTRLIMPMSAGHTSARIESGASNSDIEIPEGVAAQIRLNGVMANVEIDSQRFVKANGRYQSADYGHAENELDLVVEAGVGRVTIR